MTDHGRLWPIQLWPIHFWPSCFAGQFVVCVLHVVCCVVLCCVVCCVLCCVLCVVLCVVCCVVCCVCVVCCGGSKFSWVCPRFGCSSGPSGFHTTVRELQTHFRPRRFNHLQNSTRRTQEREREREREERKLWRKMKKTLTFSGFGGPPYGVGPHPSRPHSETTRTLILAKIGLAKIGLAKIGFGPKHDGQKWIGRKWSQQCDHQPHERRRLPSLQHKRGGFPTHHPRLLSPLLQETCFLPDLGLCQQSHKRARLG